MDDDRPPMRRMSPDYDHRPNYMEGGEGQFRSEHRAGPMTGRMPEDRDDRQRKVISIFDIDDRLRREDVDFRGSMGGAGSRMAPERFGSRQDEDEEMMTMQRGRPLLRGSAEPRMSSWDDNRAGGHEQGMAYDRRLQEDRQMPPKNRPIPLFESMMDRSSQEYSRQQRMPDMDPMMMRDEGPKRLGYDRPGSSMQDDYKQSTYYQNEQPGNRSSSRPSTADRGPSYSQDQDDRNSWSSDKLDRFSKFEPERPQSTQRQSNQPQQSSEQSDPVSLLLNLSQLLALVFLIIQLSVLVAFF